MVDTGSTEATGMAGWNSCQRCGERIDVYRTLCDVCRQHPPLGEGYFVAPYPCMACAEKDKRIAELEKEIKS